MRVHAAPHGRAQTHPPASIHAPARFYSHTFARARMYLRPPSHAFTRTSPSAAGGAGGPSGIGPPGAQTRLRAPCAPLCLIHACPRSGAPGRGCVQAPCPQSARLGGRSLPAEVVALAQSSALGVTGRAPGLSPVPGHPRLPHRLHVLSGRGAINLCRGPQRNWSGSELKETIEGSTLGRPPWR